MEKIEVREVTTRKDLADFIHLPWQLYQGNPFWVPPLKMAILDFLDTKKNPFYKHSSRNLYLAFKGHDLVGRIASIHDQKFDEFHSQKVTAFGFFESINDSEVAKALLAKVQEDAKARGSSQILGPLNPSTNHECGVLVDGFEDPPVVGMTFNPAFYDSLLKSAGLTKAKDLLAYTFIKSTQVHPRIAAHNERLKKNEKVVFRSVRMADFKKELEAILEVYNDAWEKNWGFVPLSREEFFYLAKEFKAIADPRLILIAEVAGEMAGFALSIPDVHQAQKSIRNGKLLPFGIVKLLWNLKGPFKRSTVTRARVITLGIKQKFQNLGLGPLFYAEYIHSLKAAGYQSAEASWILEDNIPMNKAIRFLGGKHYKTYRIYEASESLS